MRNNDDFLVFVETMKKAASKMKTRHCQGSEKGRSIRFLSMSKVTKPEKKITLKLLPITLSKSTLKLLTQF